MLEVETEQALHHEAKLAAFRPLLIEHAHRRGAAEPHHRLRFAEHALSPLGDERVVATQHLDRDRVAVAKVARPVHRALPATTSLSASLLHAALEGYAVPEVVALVGALGRGDLGTVARVLPGVLAIGHSSGADLLAGAAGALEALAGAVPGPTDLSLSDSTPTTAHPQPEGARRV